MTTWIVLFLNNLLPVFLIAGAGYLLSRWLQVSPQTLSQVIFYIFSPCLIFNLLTNNQLSGGDILSMMLLAGLTAAAVGLLTWLAGRALKLERRMLAAVLITSMFMNAGNFGLPVILFAFGEAGLAYASLFFVTNSILNYTVGVAIASMGSTGFAQALSNLLRIPTIYALALAVLFMRTGWQVPLPIERTTQLLGNAAIPAMLVLLGFQLKNVQWSGRAVPLALAGSMRMLVGPAIALGFSLLLGLQGPARQAGILEAAMPAAVLNTVVATVYDAEPSFVTAVVFMTTLLSPLTLTPLLAYLGA